MHDVWIAPSRKTRVLPAVCRLPQQAATAPAAAAAAAAANPGSVLSWAHVRDVTLLPDKVWQKVGAPIRNSYITFAFSGEAEGTRLGCCGAGSCDWD